jgi:hypothetical protein
VRAKLFARHGDAVEGDALARASVALADQTDALNHRGRAHVDLAEVLRLGGRADEATTEVENALQAFEQKENDVSARRARALLEELAPA